MNRRTRARISPSSAHPHENAVGRVLDRTRSAEEIWRRGSAYHEAAHAVVDVVLDHTVRYVSIETEGTDYRDVCVTSVNHMEFPGVGLIPVPHQALGHAIATIAGNMAMWRWAGIPYPFDSWHKIMREREEIEELGDPDELEGDTMSIYEYCLVAALLGRMVKMPASDELPDDAPPLPQIPSTDEEAFEIALREAERLVDSFWWAITAVAERLIEVAYLSGEEVREIMLGSDSSSG